MATEECAEILSHPLLIESHLIQRRRRSDKREEDVSAESDENARERIPRESPIES